MNDKQLFLAMIEYLNDISRSEFWGLRTGRIYNDRQKEIVFDMIQVKGIRQTAIVLGIPRRTIQRWTQDHGITVKRCPDWVYTRAEKHRKRREFFKRRGYDVTS